MAQNPSDSTEKPSTTLPGRVEKIVKPPHPSMPEKAQISVDGADDLYREIRIENVVVRSLASSRDQRWMSRLKPIRLLR